MSDPLGQPPTHPYQPSSWARPEAGGTGAPGFEHPAPPYGQPQPVGSPQAAAHPPAPAPYPPAPGAYPLAPAPYPPAPGAYPNGPGGGVYPSPLAPYGAGPPPRRRGWIAAVVAVALLLLCGGGIAVAAVLVRAVDGANATAAPGSRPATTAAATVTLTAPPTIGTLTKADDQSIVEPMREQMRNSGVDDPFVAVYDDSAVRGRKVIMSGGAGRLFGLGGDQLRLDTFFKSTGQQLGGATVGARIDVDTGSLGGKAQCGKADGLGVTMAVCAWAGPGALLGAAFGGLTPDQAAAQLRVILPAVVVTK